ncbi:RING-H2 finger protein ATL39-like [Phalaenopsis equestris]|uniref:RING-H2 finger protein ATL39-like n=1 Tax=Phalaenopsis equestris TaxID=78828 RepID=UPI0009E4A8BB|nr:RING-H2 finger protein ATL39-like [Phalaenopsis equestris]
MMGSGVNLTTTVIGLGMTATFIVFICARLSDSRSAISEIQLRSDQGPPEHVIRGLEPVVVAAIPAMKYCHEASCSKEDAQCSICLGEYQDKEMLRVMPICHHNFHLICIDVWLQMQSTCPICRLPLNTFEEKLESPFSSSLQVQSAEFTDDRTWLLPFHQHSRSGSNIQAIHETIPAVFGDPNIRT